MSTRPQDGGDPKSDPNDDATSPAQDEEETGDWGDQPTVQMPAIPMPDDQ